MPPATPAAMPALAAVLVPELASPDELEVGLGAAVMVWVSPGETVVSTVAGAVLLPLLDALVADDDTLLDGSAWSTRNLVPLR